jgi:hypothetical protein
MGQRAIYGVRYCSVIYIHITLHYGERSEGTIGGEERDSNTNNTYLSNVVFYLLTNCGSCLYPPSHKEVVCCSNSSHQYILRSRTV